MALSQDPEKRARQLAALEAGRRKQAEKLAGAGSSHGSTEAPSVDGPAPSPGSAPAAPAASQGYPPLSQGTAPARKPRSKGKAPAAKPASRGSAKAAKPASRGSAGDPPAPRQSRLGSFLSGLANPLE